VVDYPFVEWFRIHVFIRSLWLLLGVPVSRGIGSGFGQNHTLRRNAVLCPVGE